MTGTPTTRSNVLQLVPPLLDPDSPRTAPPGRAALQIPPDRATYTVAEVAYLINLSLGSTYALLRDGTIPARKVGARWIISRHRFRDWLDHLPEATEEDWEREIRRYEREQRRAQPDRRG